MSERRHSESAFETVTTNHLLNKGYVLIFYEGFDRQPTIFRQAGPAFIAGS